MHNVCFNPFVLFFSESEVGVVSFFHTRCFFPRNDNIYTRPRCMYFYFLDSRTKYTLARTKRVCKMTTAPAKRHAENRINRRRLILYHARTHTRLLPSLHLHFIRMFHTHAYAHTHTQAMHARECVFLYENIE